MNNMVECRYPTCNDKNSDKCNKCMNNTKRNYRESFYVEAKEVIPKDKGEKLTYDGPCEQTSGYKCPVCGGYTNPYMVRDNTCSHCGYILNI